MVFILKAICSGQNRPGLVCSIDFGIAQRSKKPFDLEGVIAIWSVWWRVFPPKFVVSRCFHNLKIATKGYTPQMDLQTKKSYGLIIFCPEMPVIAKTVVSRIKPIVRAIKKPIAVWYTKISK